MKYFYGIQATGRGHVSRFLVLREILVRMGHEVTAVACGQELPSYAADMVRFEEGPTFFLADNRVALGRTLRYNLARLPRFRRIVSETTRELSDGGYDEAIVDFEPLTARAARRSGIRTTLFDNQTAAFFGHPLPGRLRRYRAQLRLFVRAYYGGVGWPARILTYSLVEADPVLPNQIVVPPCIRKEVANLQPSSGEHLLYYKSIGGLPDGLLDFARAHPSVEVRVYAPHGRAVAGMPDNLRLREHDNSQFLEDFASCRAYITNAGFESIAEAIHLRKPLVVIPIAGQWEQQINAHLIEASGLGRSMQTLDRGTFEAALSQAHAPAEGARAWIESGRARLEAALSAG